MIIERWFQFSIGDAASPKLVKELDDSGMFQFSIGDADVLREAERRFPRARFNSLLEMLGIWRMITPPWAAVSILYWRCALRRAEHLRAEKRRFQFSIGDALLNRRHVLLDLTSQVFQFSIGDADRNNSRLTSTT